MKFFLVYLLQIYALINVLDGTDPPAVGKSEIVGQGGEEKSVEEPNLKRDGGQQEEDDHTTTPQSSDAADAVDQQSEAHGEPTTTTTTTTDDQRNEDNKRKWELVDAFDRMRSEIQKRSDPGRMITDRFKIEQKIAEELGTCRSKIYAWKKERILVKEKENKEKEEVSATRDTQRSSRRNHWVFLVVYALMLFPVLSTLKLAMLLQQQSGGETASITTASFAASDNRHAKRQCDKAVWTEMDSYMKCCSRMAAAIENPSKMACHLHIEFPESSAWSTERIIWRITNANASDATFDVTIRRWNGSSRATLELFNALSPLNVIALDLRPILTDRPIEMKNLGLFFPKLQKLTLSGPIPPINEEIRRRPSLIGATFLRDLPLLKALKASNTDVSLGDEEAQWSASIERLDVVNCSLFTSGVNGDGSGAIAQSANATVLPHWMTKWRRIERISIINSGLRSALQLAHAGQAVQLRAKHNRIGDLHRVVFECTRLTGLDLRDNVITKIGAHTLTKCHFLRFLDLSDNLMAELPDKLFQGCRRLRELRLERIGLRSVHAELFLGLNALKSLSLAGNPLSRIDPFTFWPVRSVRALHLDNCTLAHIPLAVTQCCLLDSLSMDDNRFATRNAMPAPLVALLPRLSHFSFARNPLVQLPWALFLYESRRADDALLEGIVDTLIKLPVWRLDPCTPYLWHFHLRNASSVPLQRRMSAWNELRMHLDGLAHCGHLYETIIEGMAIYRELRENNGCEATRRLRLVRAGGGEDSKNAVAAAVSCATSPTKAARKKAPSFTNNENESDDSVAGNNWQQHQSGGDAASKNANSYNANNKNINIQQSGDASIGRLPSAAPTVVVALVGQHQKNDGDGDGDADGHDVPPIIDQNNKALLLNGGTNVTSATTPPPPPPPPPPLPASLSSANLLLLWANSTTDTQHCAAHPILLLPLSVNLALLLLLIGFFVWLIWRQKIGCWAVSRTVAAAIRGRRRPNNITSSSIRKEQFEEIY